MCVEARYLKQYIHFSLHRFCDAESSRGLILLLSLTIDQPHSLCVAGSGSGVKLLPPVLAAHAGNIESIVAQITLTMYIQQYITTHDFKQIHIIVSLFTLTISLTMGLLRSQKRL